jgi:hypothetical protein
VQFSSSNTFGSGFQPINSHNSCKDSEADFISSSDTFQLKDIQSERIEEGQNILDNLKTSVLRSISRGNLQVKASVEYVKATSPRKHDDSHENIRSIHDESN